MNRPTHRQTLWAGLAILLVVNVIALGGAAWNRSTIESKVNLSERELNGPYAWRGDGEDSGVSLSLKWRAIPAPDSTAGDDLTALSYYGADPGWLDVAKLEALGFNVTPPPADGIDRDWRRRARRVTLVLELDGGAYAQSLAAAVRAAAQARAKATAVPGDESLATRNKAATEALIEEQTRASRLFAVDAGLELDSLRAKYPDRQRYVLVPALVQMYWQHNKDEPWRAVGNIQRLLNTQIHLSRAQAAALAPALAGSGSGPYSDNPARPIAVEVAYGRRLEPWILSARVR